MTQMTDKSDGARELLERIAVLLETAAQFGVETKYEDGSETPNAKLFRESHAALTALLAAAKEPRK